MIKNVKIPRCYNHISDNVYYELHTFVDDSEHAAAAVSYLVIFHGATQGVVFMSSKTKIAPNKYLSIPRMELQPAVMGVRLTKCIQLNQSIDIRKINF